MIFLIMLFTLSTGWIIIKIYAAHKDQVVMKNVQRRFDNGERDDVLDIINQERVRFEDRKTMFEKMFSFKAFHGILMAMAWFQLAGRMMVTNPFDSWDGCWAYPAVYENGTVHFLPQEDPNISDFISNTPLFVGVTIVPFLVVSLIIWVVGSFISAKQGKKKSEKMRLL